MMAQLRNRKMFVTFGSLKVFKELQVAGKLPVLPWEPRSGLFTAGFIGLLNLIEMGDSHIPAVSYNNKEQFVQLQQHFFFKKNLIKENQSDFTPILVNNTRTLHLIFRQHSCSM